MPTKPDDIFEFTDHAATRSRIFDGTLKELSSVPPLENENYMLTLDQVKLHGPTEFSLKDQKKAILSGSDLAVPVKGRWTLFDKKTKQVVDQKEATLGSLPYLTQRGTFIRRGVEYVVAHQSRLKPGVYSRQKESGELEAHINPATGSGRAFRIMLEPDTGKFKMQIGQSSMPLASVLSAMGVNNKTMLDQWGGELTDANTLRTDSQVVAKIKRHLGRPNDNTERSNEYLLGLFGKMQLDPDVTERTLGNRVTNVSPELIFRITNKLLNIQRGKEEVDDRDSLAYQTLHSTDDFIKERIHKDGGGLLRQALWKASGKKSVEPLRYNFLAPYLSAVLRSSFANPLEEVNPLELLDQHHRVTRLGEGGISDTSAVPMEARTVQPSHFLFIDPVKTPESDKLGVDTRIAYKTYRRGNQLVTPVHDRTGKLVYVTPEALTKAVVAFPGEMEDKTSKYVRVMDRGRLHYANRKDVDYVAPDETSMFTPMSNMVPLNHGVKGQRLSMGGRMLTQALALKDPEAPYLQSLNPDTGESFERTYGRDAGVISARADGEVLAVTPDGIKVRDAEGVHTYELNNNLPFNRKSFLSNTPVVKPGDKIRAGQLLAPSNFTTKDGTIALGKNLLTAYSNYRGLNYEDAVVISESAAKKLSSEHMYQHQLEPEGGIKFGLNPFKSLFPSRFNREQIAKIDDTGVIRPGQVVKYGDPLILALGERKPSGASAIYRPHKLIPTDQSVTWDHSEDGLVTDVTPLKNGGWHVAIKAYRPAVIGDKLSNRYGAKGVISEIVPDSKMLRDSEGNIVDLILNPTGIITRGNPSSVVDAVYGKIAHKTGKPFVLRGASHNNMVKEAKRALAAVGMKAEEDLYDPMRDAKIRNVFVGRPFIMKLHHMSEDKEHGRGALGDEDVGYTADEMPAKGGVTGSKRLSVQDINAMVAHGAIENLRDAHLIRGQRNDDFWRTLRLGGPIPTPKPGFIHKKFFEMMRGAGINTEKRGDAFHVMALTDRDIDKLSSGELTNDKLVMPDTMDPHPGGLFDFDLTGGHGGKKWSHVKLAVPMPSPVMETPIKKLLGLTQSQFEDVLAGRHKIGGETGMQGMLKALEQLNVDREILQAKQTIRTGSAAKRDDAVKKLGYLMMMKEKGIQPADFVWSKLPVLPPAFRPIIKMPNNVTAVADANQLYRDAIRINSSIKRLQGRVPEDQLGDDVLTLYNSVKAVAGLGDPVGQKSKDQKVHGLLSHIFGRSPKWGIVQRQLISKPQDAVGRAVITPDPSLDIDEVGLPVDTAWAIYSPFIMRRLVRAGMPAQSAASAVSKRSPEALRELTQEMKERPVLINRAPTLHRFSIQAAWPKMTSGSTLRIPPMLTPGPNADFDGDMMNAYVPVSDKARNEAIQKMLPSRNLLESSRFGVHLTPRHEFLHGLAVGSGTIPRKGSGQVRVFKTVADAIAAFRRGQLSATDQIEIRQ